jgi:hypothetical protein
MTCSRCRKNFADDESRCPYCGEANAAASGLFQTSTVLISEGDSETIYRSVDEVPSRLRTRLIKSTNGANSATILIADQRGRKEIAKAMRNLPGPAQRRLRSTILGKEQPAGWLTPVRKRLIVGAILLLALLVVAFVFRVHLGDALR